MAKGDRIVVTCPKCGKSTPATITMTDGGQIVGPFVMGAVADLVDLSAPFVLGAPRRTAARQARRPTYRKTRPLVEIGRVDNMAGWEYRFVDLFRGDQPRGSNGFEAFVEEVRLAGEDGWEAVVEGCPLIRATARTAIEATEEVLRQLKELAQAERGGGQQ